MKKLFLILAYILISKLFFAQTKDLPDCKTIKKELAEVHNSFDNIVEKFRSKEDKVSFVKTYFSDFSICSEKGKIKDYGRNIEFIFTLQMLIIMAAGLSSGIFIKGYLKKLKMSLPPLMFIKYLRSNLLSPVIFMKRVRK